MGKSETCVRLTGLEVPMPLDVRVDPYITVPTLMVSRATATQTIDEAYARMLAASVEIPLTAEKVNGRLVWSTEGGHGEFKPLDQSEPFRVPLAAANVPVWGSLNAKERFSLSQNDDQKYLLRLPPDTDLELTRFAAPVAIAAIPATANISLQQMGFVQIDGNSYVRPSEGSLSAQGVLFLACKGQHRIIRAKHVREIELADWSDFPISVSLKGSKFVRLDVPYARGKAEIETNVLRQLWLRAPHADVTIRAKQLRLGLMYYGERGLRTVGHRVEVDEIGDLYAQGPYLVSDADHAITFSPDPIVRMMHHVQWPEFGSPQVSERDLRATASPEDIELFRRGGAASGRLDVPSKESEPLHKAAKEHLLAVDRECNPLSEFGDLDLSQGTPTAVIERDGIGFKVEPPLLRRDFSGGPDGRAERDAKRNDRSRGPDTGAPHDFELGF